MVALLMALPAGAVNPEYTTGVTAYGAKNFREAVRCFGDVVRAEPRNVSAVYYLASSYFSLGQKTAALNYFKWLAANYPATSEGRSAAAILARLGAQAAANGEPVAASQPEKSSEVIRGGGRVDPDKMVVVVRNLADHPAVQPAVIDTVKSAIRSVPGNVVSFLNDQGCKVYVTPTMIDKEPDLVNTHPRGYEQGRTYKDVPACFDGKNVIVCNYAMRGTDEWQPTGDPGGSVKHEMGHALDKYLGYLSMRDDFKHIYYKDCGQVDPDTKEKLAYYVQKAEGGPSECFAECVCTIFGGGISGGTHNPEHVKDMRAAFPNVIKYIEAQLAGL